MKICLKINHLQLLLGIQKFFQKFEDVKNEQIFPNNLKISMDCEHI